jgi:hypothetical protein
MNKYGSRLLAALCWLIYIALCTWAYVDAAVGWLEIRGWIYRHETLTTGILAVGSALVGSALLYYQTTMSDRHERERRLRRRESVRTVLALSLSSICEYASKSAEASKALLDQCDKDGNLPPRAGLKIPLLPELPTEAIHVLRDLVESVDLSETRTVATLIADIQVQQARLATSIAEAGATERIATSWNFEEYLIDCGRIYARASSLFSFARRRSERMQLAIRWSDVKSALRLFGIYDEDYETLDATLVRRSGGDLDRVVADRWGNLG